MSEIERKFLESGRDRKHFRQVNRPGRERGFRIRQIAIGHIPATEISATVQGENSIIVDGMVSDDVQDASMQAYRTTNVNNDIADIRNESHSYERERKIERLKKGKMLVRYASVDTQDIEKIKLQLVGAGYHEVR